MMNIDAFRNRIIDRARDLGVLDDDNREIVESLWLEGVSSELLPEKGQSIAVVYKLTKTASLFFDRVFTLGQEGLECPDDIKIRVRTELPRLFHLWLASMFNIKNRRLSDPFDWSEINIRTVYDTIVEEELKEYFKIEDDDSFFQKAGRRISEELWSERKILSCPLYSSTMDYDQEFSRGNADLLFYAISNLQIIDDNALSWKQVQEVRDDKEFKQKIRRLLHWANQDFVGKPISFIEDEISIRIEDYEWALKKHGIMTIQGALKSVLDSKFLVGSAAASLSLSALSGSAIAGLIAQGGLVIGNIALEVSKVLLDHEEVKRGPNSEISYIYELKKKFKNIKHNKANSADAKSSAAD